MYICDLGAITQKEICNLMRRDIKPRTDTSLRRIQRIRPQLTKRCGVTTTPKQAHLCEASTKNTKMSPISALR